MRAWLMTLAAVAATGAVLALPESAMAWGPKGHELVGKIADKHLTKQARDAITELLQGHSYSSLSDGRLPNWADAIRGSNFYKKKFPTMAQWHFIDLDVDLKLEDVKLEDLKDKDNALMALRKFQAVLKDPEKSLQDRREALFFVAHFVGDIHQPLHCAMRNNDKGGNLVRTHLSGDNHHVVNLHKIWDTNLVEEAMGILTPADYATRLTITLGADKRKEYQKGTLEDWILDSHKIARKKVYFDGDKEITRKKDEVHNLSSDYVLDRAEVVEVQLTKGGVRLAQFLNDTFKD